MYTTGRQPRRLQAIEGWRVKFTVMKPFSNATPSLSMLVTS
jgi:hypothetical protein